MIRRGNQWSAPGRLRPLENARGGKGGPDESSASFSRLVPRQWKPDSRFSSVSPWEKHIQRQRQKERKKERKKIWANG